MKSNLQLSLITIFNFANYELRVSRKKGTYKWFRMDTETWLPLHYTTPWSALRLFVTFKRNHGYAKIKLSKGGENERLLEL